MAPTRQPFVPTEACAEQLACLRRQTANQIQLASDYIRLAERNHTLEAELAALKEALQQRSAAQEAENTLLKEEVARLRTSNAKLQNDLDAEKSNNEALKAELHNADLDAEDLREEYAGNLYEVREAYKQAQRECARQLEAAQEQRLGLERRLHNLPATAQEDQSQDEVAADDAWLHAACGSLIKAASTASLAGQLILQASGEDLLCREAAPASPAPSEHTLFADAQPTIPAPAAVVLYQGARPASQAPVVDASNNEAAAVPFSQTGQGACMSLGPDGLLEAKLGCCLLFHTLAEQYVVVSIISAAC